MDTGSYLKYLRAKKRLTQQQVADQLDIKRARYNAWENNLSKPDWDMVQKLADFFNVMPGSIMGLTDRDTYEKQNKLKELHNETQELLNQVQKDIEEDVSIDYEIRAIQRAAKKMSPKDKKKMLNMVKAAFEEAFSDDD